MYGNSQNLIGQLMINLLKLVGQLPHLPHCFRQSCYLISVSYFFSDASAIIEHTDRVIYLEDDDVAAISNGVLTIHR